MPNSYTKAILADALLRLMREKVLDDISVVDIVELSCVNRKTFYYHFHSVADLIDWMVERDLNAAAGAEPNPDNWTECTASVMEYIRDNKFVFSAIHYSRYKAGVRQKLKELLDEKSRVFLAAAEEYYARIYNKPARIAESSANYIVKFYSAALYSLLEEWMLGGMKEEIPQFVQILQKLTRDTMYSAFEAFAE